MKQTFGPFLVKRGTRTVKVSVTLDPQAFAENLANRALHNTTRKAQIAFGAGEVTVLEIVERPLGGDDFEDYGDDASASFRQQYRHVR